MLSQPEPKLVQDRLLRLVCGMIRKANHLRRGTDGLGVGGHRVARHCFEHFGRSGRVANLCRDFGIDGSSILHGVKSLAPGRLPRATGGTG